MDIKPLTITELNELVNTVLSTGYDFGNVTIEGEISGFWKSQGKPFGGFDLKDGNSVLPCFIVLTKLKFPIEDGMKVIITGRPRLRENGRFSYTIDSIEPFGEGALKRAYELLKAKLEREGLFAVERKRTLPRFPSRIGLITARDSAAYHDFVNTLNKRFGGLAIVFAPVLVQGKDAPDEIVAALKGLAKMKDLDAIALIRGGGSLEDLQAFNSERVARAVFASRIPVIVGVGHDVDVSLADLSADVRAKTPTDAAVILVPERHTISYEINFMTSKMNETLKRRVREYDLSLANAVTYISHFVTAQEKKLYVSIGRLNKDFAYFMHEIHEQKDRIARSQKVLIGRFGLFTDGIANKVDYLSRTLGNLDPQKLLARGYSIVFNNDKVVKSSKAIRAGDRLTISLSDGKLESEVIRAS